MLRGHAERPHGPSARVEIPPHDNAFCSVSENERILLQSCPDQFLMVILAEEAGCYCFAYHRVKRSSLPRGQDRS